MVYVLIPKEHIDKTTYKNLKSRNIIADGMLPKLENCFEALHHGVERVIIGNQKVIIDNSQKHTTITL